MSGTAPMGAHAPVRPPRKERGFPGWVHEAGLGLSLLGRGLSFVWARPRLALLGMLPALLASVLLGAVVGGAIVVADPLVSWATHFADDWHPMAAQILRAVLALAIVLGVVFLCVLAFASVTLLVGEPVYEKISAAVERACGDELPEVREGVGAKAKRAAGDATGMALLALRRWLLLAVVSLVPVVGSAAAAGLGAIFGGRLMTLEVMSIPMERRGAGSLRLRQGWVRYRPTLALGFGVPVYLLFLVPLLSVLVFPGVVAGATLLVRELLGQPTDTRRG